MSDSKPMTCEEQSAVIHVAAGPANLRAELRLTTRGIVAIGGLVSGVLLSTAVLVWTATSVARLHPLASRIRPR